MIVVQGAGGGGEQLSSTGFYGGGGGFVHGLLEVKGGEKLIVVVGDGGRAGNTPQVQKAVNMRIPRTHLCMQRWQHASSRECACYTSGAST